MRFWPLLAFLCLCGTVDAQLAPEFPPGVFDNTAALQGKPPAAYTGIGDIAGLSSNNPIAWWGLRCFSSTTSGTIADITDSATGNTTGTRLQCAAGGIVTAVVSASACTFVTGFACSTLATTCAVGCNVRELYDQSPAGREPSYRAGDQRQQAVVLQRRWFNPLRVRHALYGGKLSERQRRDGRAELLHGSQQCQCPSGRGVVRILGPNHQLFCRYTHWQFHHPSSV